MTENELAEATLRLARSEEKFLSTIRMLIESLDSMRDFLRDNREYFQTGLTATRQQSELMQTQVNLLKEISAGMQAVVKTGGENNGAITENTERMKALLAKVESYFGSGGLEYEN